jgi:hypothetical protein
MWRVLLVLFFVQSVFSLWPILVKVAIENGVNAILLSFTRDVFASGLLWTGVWLETGRPNLWNVLVHTLMTPVKMYHLVP